MIGIATMKPSKQEVRHPARSSSTGAYSDGVILDGWLFISGQGPLDLATGSVISGTIEEETRLTLSHIGKILEVAGSTLDDVVKCTCHLADIRDFDAFNHAYGQVFHGVRPARTTVQAVLGGGIKVEIDAIARVAGQGRRTI
jgi:2-iminobutanoate/2-iminopropanoate deaminase